MSWYNTGTIAVTNSGTSVTGSGTAWVANAAAGMGFRGPDGLVYEIASVTSDTALTLATTYKGTTVASGGAYSLMPTQDYIRFLASQVSGLITSYQTIASNAGSGKFGDGTAASPGITWSANTNTGFYRPATGVVACSTNGAEAWRTDSSGRFGIGTKSPAALLHVYSSTGNAYGLINTAATYNASIVLAGNGQAAFTNSFYLQHTSVGGYITMGGAQPIIIGISGAEKARWESSAGYLLLGYTSSNGAYRLQVNSQIFATSSTVATSDGRYKQDVQTLSGGLELIKSLRPVEFSWSAHPVHQFPAGRTVGFIAQEVQAALAGRAFADTIVKSNAVELPDGSSEQFLGLAEGNLIALLVAAVQELAAEVRALKSPASPP